LNGAGLEMQSDVPTRSWQTFAVVLPDGVDREAIRGKMADGGVETQVASYGLHTLSAYKDDPAKFPVSDRLHRQAMALPLWNGLPEADVDRVCDTLLAALAL
jgi:dTDP-4-amino-4,6-dideoxygalactose transaminase